MAERNQFTFYRSFYETIMRIKNKDARRVAFEVVAAYALDGVLPDIEKLPDAVVAIFTLSKPTLDASLRKSEGRRSQERGKTPARCEQDPCKIPQDHGKEGENKKEVEKENENEVENEREYKREKEKESYALFSSSPPTPQGADGDDVELKNAFSEYQRLLGNFLSTSASEELIGYFRELGNEVCLHALETAQDNGVIKWAYIRAILQNYRNSGVKSLEDAKRLDAQRQDGKPAEYGLRGKNAPPSCKFDKPIDLEALKAKMEEL